MPLTVAAVETTLIVRTRAALINAGLTANPDTDASPRPYLSDPISTALEWYGIYPADRTAPADAEVALVADADLAGFLDLAELRTLESALQQVLSAPQRESWEDYSIWRNNNNSITGLEALILAKRRAWTAAQASAAQTQVMTPVVRNSLVPPWPWTCPGDPRPGCC